MNTKEEQKQVKKQLQDRSYVLQLTSLSPVEREILQKKYKRDAYKYFRFKRNAKSLEQLSTNLNAMISEMQCWLNHNDRTLIQMIPGYRDHSICLRAAASLSDATLIKYHRADINEQFDRERLRLKQEALQAMAKQKTYQRSISKFLKNCSKQEAAKILKLVKTKAV